MSLSPREAALLASKARRALDAVRALDRQAVLVATSTQGTPEWQDAADRLDLARSHADTTELALIDAIHAQVAR